VLAAFVLGGHIKMMIEGYGSEIEPYRPISMGFFMIFFLITGINNLKNETNTDL
jgi:hypothetical protein